MGHDMCVKPELKTGKNALLSVAGWDTQEVEGGPIDDEANTTQMWGSLDRD